MGKNERYNSGDREGTPYHFSHRSWMHGNVRCPWPQDRGSFLFRIVHRLPRSGSHPVGFPLPPDSYLGVPATRRRHSGKQERFRTIYIIWQPERGVWPPSVPGCTEMFTNKWRPGGQLHVSRVSFAVNVSLRVIDNTTGCGYIPSRWSSAIGDHHICRDRAIA